MEGFESLKATPRQLNSRALATVAWDEGTLTVVMRDGTV
jgi:hypothetical protein